MRVLAVNAGSSTLKLRVLDGGDALVASYDLAADAPLPDPLPEVDAIGHRVVHGGAEFRAGVRINDDVLDRLHALADLAPLHQPAALRAIDSVRKRLPGLPEVACFDTAFHATLPAAAATYAVPRPWREDYGVRRYGFHGLAHAWAARRGAELLGRPLAELRLVTCHLGAGASLTAVSGGRSVDTTMGFTPMEGLVMATRPGRLDAGILLWLQQRRGVGIAELDDSLQHRSGLRALAGTADMAICVAAAEAGDRGATLAVEVYLHRLRTEIAAMTASLGGLDAVVFSGGVGENATSIREHAIAGLAFLGLGLDPVRNAATRSDGDVTATGATARVLVVNAREDLEIAREVRRVLGAR